MSTTFTGGPSFFTRPSVVENGKVAELDGYVQKPLDVLSKILGKKFLQGAVTGITTVTGGTARASASASASTGTATGVTVEDAVKQKDIASLLAKIVEDPSLATFSDIIDERDETTLFAKVEELIKITAVAFNARRILQYKPIRAFLFCKAKFGLKRNTDSAIFNYMINEEDGGTRLIYDYVAAEAAKGLIEKEKLEIGSGTPEDFVKTLNLGSTNILFAKKIFSDKLRGIIKNKIFNSDEITVIEAVKGKLKIADSDIPALVNYMKNSNIEIDASNAEFYLSHALAEIKNENVSFSSSSATAADDSDFAVVYYDDENTTLEFNRESVLCAAQLYYVMTLGDELDIFNTVNTIITRYLPGGQVDITNKETLKDLQLYVFNDSFKDLATGTIHNRTEPSERRMFYRQVFNAGSEEAVDSMVLNKDFNVLWGTLMEEVVKYISKREKAENPESGISHQPVLQCIEDLRVNFTSGCQGLPKIAAPIMYKELDFVVQRILMNEEIRKQLAPNGSGSFWKVIENVQKSTRKEVPNIPALRNKAVYGHKIITEIANYKPEEFENEAIFGRFISTVEAYIIANSQLEQSSEEKYNSWREEEGENGEMESSSSDQDEWEF